MARPKRETKFYQGYIFMPIWEKLQEIKAELSLSTDISALEYCIREVYEDRNKPWAVALKNRTPHETDPEKKAQRQIEEKEAKERLQKEMNFKNGTEIANALDGKVIDHGNGFFSVEYRTYDLSTPHYVSTGKLVVPFEQLNENHIINQYKASVPYEGSLKEVIHAVLEKQEQ